MELRDCENMSGVLCLLVMSSVIACWDRHLGNVQEHAGTGSQHTLAVNRFVSESVFCGAGVFILHVWGVAIHGRCRGAPWWGSQQGWWFPVPSSI